MPTATDEPTRNPEAVEGRKLDGSELVALARHTIAATEAAAATVQRRRPIPSCVFVKAPRRLPSRWEPK
jgi:hypothetical protein